MINILMLGTALDTKGGVSTVVNQYLNSNLLKKFNIEYIETHSDGTIKKNT